MNEKRKSVRKVVILLLLALIIFIFKSNPSGVEHWYTNGCYPFISKFLRGLFGWIPFSIGDLIYFCIAIYILYIIFALIRSIRQKTFRSRFNRILFYNFLSLFLTIYIVFNLLWGMNYERLGIASQLQLQVQPYSTRDLVQLSTILEQRLNNSSLKIDSIKRLRFQENKVLFQAGKNMYDSVKVLYPFLSYSYPSIKPSLYSHIGQYFGFTGYYNPFSGEAQIKTTVPVFLKPYILIHEMAHQLGYAMENEANFTAYLVCRRASDPDFQYSAYLDLTLYAMAELHVRDSVSYRSLKQNWSTRVISDYHSYINYLRESQNPVEPWIMRFYDGYLKMNNQPKGTSTYNEVIALLIAYMKKFGEEAI